MYKKSLHEWHPKHFEPNILLIYAWCDVNTIDTYWRKHQIYFQNDSKTNRQKLDLKIFFLIGLPSNGVDFFLTWIFTTRPGIKIQSIVGRLHQGWREIICLSEWHQQTFNWIRHTNTSGFFLKPDCVYIYVRRKGHSSQNKGGETWVMSVYNS